MPFGFNEFAAPAVLLILAGVFLAFVWERFPPDAVGLGGVGLLLALGLLEIGDLLSVLSNPALPTIASMFILSGALVRTGVIEAFGTLAGRLAGKAPTLALVFMLLGVMTSSAFVNNTPVVLVMIPVVIAVARNQHRSPSRFLMPMSYAAILGGTCTLIGTSTNLLVDGMAQEHGLAPFGIFEITALGLLAGFAGILYMWLIGQRLLPERQSVSELLESARRPRFLAEVMIPSGSPLVGRSVSDVAIFQRAEGRVIDVLRGDESLRRKLDEVVLEPGDRVVLKTRADEILSLREEGQVDFRESHALEPIGQRRSVVAEGLVGPNSPILGRRLGRLRIRRRYGVYPLAVHRSGENIGSNLDEVTLEPGDTLLLEGARADINRLSEDQGLINLTESSERPYRRAKAPIVVAAIASIMALAALGVMPIAGLAIIGVAVVLLTRCIDMDEAYRSLDGRILVLILSMLAISAALESSGAMMLIVNAVMPLLIDLPPIAMLAAVYVLTSLLTETITNNAVAVLLTPIVIGLAVTMGHDPRPFVVAVMFAASASFATPIGYQTNMMVYTAGGYRFHDFLKIGVPLNLLIGLVVVLLIPFLWPL